MDQILSWWPLLGTIINLGVLWVAWTIRQVAEARLREATVEIDGHIDDHGTRLTRLEERMKHMPTHEDVAQLSEAMGGLRREVGELGADLRGLRDLNAGVSQQVARIHTWLMERTSS